MLPLALTIFLLVALLAAFRSYRGKNQLEKDYPFYSGNFAVESPPPTEELTVVSYNISYGKNVEQALAEIEEFQSRKAVNILLLQEMNETGAEKMARELQLNFVYYPAAIEPKYHRNFGNVVLSRWPIVESQKVVNKYFGDIPSGPPVARYDSWIAKRTGVTRQTAQDRVPQARLFKVWNVPGWGTEEATLLSLAANVLSSGKSSRLYKRLVYHDQIATSVSASVDPTEIGGQFYIDAMVKPGGDIRKVEQAIDEELAKFLKSGPMAEELLRLKTQYEAGFIRGIERVGGFGGTSDILAQNQVYGRSPGYYKTVL